MAIRSIITASGSCIPTKLIPNSFFNEHSFYEIDGSVIQKANVDVIEKFREITSITERRYAEDDQVASDLAVIAARDTFESSGFDPELLDYIIVAHNFGDVIHQSNRVDIVPSLASRVKQKLGIKNSDCVAYDLPFGCPGWLQGVIQADYYIKSGDAKHVMVIGAETLSRIIDPHDRDSMIYADGAGAVIMSASENNSNAGIIAHKTRTDAVDQAFLLKMQCSSNIDFNPNDLYLKMNGRKLYEYALTNVPIVVNQSLEKAGVKLADIKKVLIHQANAKMDEAILKRIFQLNGITGDADKIMPMTIELLGNSSVATIPTLLDKILKKQMPDHTIESGDLVVFASVGAGMNINSVVYRF